MVQLPMKSWSLQSEDVFHSLYLFEFVVYLLKILTVKLGDVYTYTVVFSWILFLIWADSENYGHSP